jgi:tRNA threonylcarbamoyladenosine biosynthesis protein TsaE
VTPPRLADPHPAWPERFAREAAAITQALGDVAVQVEHVGSTAVPGLAAKPTIDVAVGASTLELAPEAVARMERLGYVLADDPGRPWERRFRRGTGVPWEAIVHVVEWGGSAWADFLRFRDALRADPALASEYEELKRALLEERGEWYRGRHKEELIHRVLGAAPHRSFRETSSAEETEAVAAQLAERLAVGDVVTVSGELGSGKTTFVRGASRALGVTSAVTSPTFTIGHRYAGRVDVSHLDLYRFSGLSPAEWGDLEPYFEDAVVFVEWPEAGAGAMPEPVLEVRLAHAGGDRRRMELAARESALLEGVA